MLLETRRAAGARRKISPSSTLAFSLRTSLALLKASVKENKDRDETYRGVVDQEAFRSDGS